MKTCCPSCQTSFRVTPEQLKARAGKVRCGMCQAVFNALDSLLEETPHTTVALSEDISSPASAGTTSSPVMAPVAPEAVSPIEAAEKPKEGPESAETSPAEPPNETSTPQPVRTSDLIVPRETREIPGYSKWAEGTVNTAVSTLPGKHSKGPFLIVTLLLMLVLAGQVIFHFRSEIAVNFPSLRPTLQAMSETLNANIPLTRHAELISIETSDLQADPARSTLLVLQATLRNRASYEQAYPLLELSLTDTLDNAIARRIFKPEEYLLPQNPPDQPFPANTDIAIRLWVEAKEISAAGYRLYVFYP